MIVDADWYKGAKRVRIIDSATKHDISIVDIEYVYKNAVSGLVLVDDPKKVMLFGWDTAGRALEVGYFRDGEVNVVMHANKLRKTYEKYLMNWTKYQVLEDLL
ncbi:hypothetical protein FACS1894104_2930 [Actinomycetota bacterium]|nr:hypothetical protein FACS1894104_2930 [Actinomycetota bacterium]